VVFENIFIFFGTPMFIHTQIVNQTTFELVDPNTVTKLQFISLKAKLVYVGRQRTNDVI